MEYLVGISRRRPPDPAMGPLRHAYTNRRASRTGRNMLAVCGASILPRPWTYGGRTVPFHPNHPRACPGCAKALR